MNRSLEDRLIRQVARSLVWHDAPSSYRETALRQARAIVSDLLDAHANGRAAQRAIVLLEERIQEGSGTNG